jgi:hypothetical protein
MNQYLKIFQFFLITLAYKFFAVSVVHATNVVDIGYPAFVSSTSPADFVANLYIYALGISGTLATIMIVYGGIKYLTSAGNESALGDAKVIITSAIWGILLLAGAYLVLNTINPQLVELRNPGLEALPATPSVPSSLESYDSRTQLTSQEGYTIASRFGISIYSSGNCKDQSNPKCTSFQGFPKAAMCQLIYMNAHGAGDITVTGGTEMGHKEHGPGVPTVDLRFSKFVSKTDGYILSETGKDKNYFSDNLNNFSKRVPGSSGNTYVLESNPDHWHVQLQLKNDADLTGIGPNNQNWYQCVN